MKPGLSLGMLVAATLLASSVSGRGMIQTNGQGVAGQAAPETATHHADWPTTGSYPSADGFVYIGMDGDPSHPQPGYYDEHSRRLGTLLHASGQHYRSQEAPFLDFDLKQPTVAVVEDRHQLKDANGQLGYSLWHVKDARHRPLIVLIQGADNATRDFGFLVPYFVAHGLDVATYDQRGTGESTGNWRYTSPQSKAVDVIAMLHQLGSDPAVDSKREGVWGPSNGGWVAPLVAIHHPLAFMILKSAPSESIADNILYEVRQVLQQHAKFSTQQIDAAMRFETNMFRYLETNQEAIRAAAALANARSQPWFSLMRIPPDLGIPPPAPMLAALRAALVYDPTPVLERATTPTLALFGAHDRNVDTADSERGFRKAFRKSGMRDYTVRVFPGADHLLVESKSGYVDEEPDAAKFSRGYPDIMVRWLGERGLTH